MKLNKLEEYGIQPAVRNESSDEEGGFDEFVASQDVPEEPNVIDRIVKKALKDQIPKLGKQKKIPTKSNIFGYYEERLQRGEIDRECYGVAMVVLSAPATQVSVERAFSALAIVMEPLRTCLKGDVIDDILVCALNADLLELVNFDM